MSSAIPNRVSFRYAKILEEKRSSMKVGITNNKERILTIDAAGESLYKRCELNERQLVQLWFWALMKP